MNHKLTLILDRDLPPRLRCRRLRTVVGQWLRTALRLHRPPISARDHVNIFLRHFPKSFAQHHLTSPAGQRLPRRTIFLSEMLDKRTADVKPLPVNVEYATIGSVAGTLLLRWLRHAPRP